MSYLVAYLAKNKKLSLPERHLGLVPAGELDTLSELFNELSDQINETVDIKKILEIASSREDVLVDYAPVIKNKEPINIAIAKDKVFNFYYQDSLDLLEEYYNVTWKAFSPLNDKKLPDDVHGIFLGGGFPEMFPKELSDNKELQDDLLSKLNAGIPYIAECGALMYLCEKLIDLDGNSHDMLGWLEGNTEMTTRLQNFGYSTLTTLEESVYGDISKSIRVHEFHRSKANVSEKEIYKLEKIRYGEVVKSWNCGYKKKNGVAAYAHIHFGSNLDFGSSFVKSCIAYKKEM